LEPVDFDSGNHRFDLDFATAPFTRTDKSLIKLKLGRFVATSILLIIRKV
jgi:hypothetical protein